LTPNAFGITLAPFRASVNLLGALSDLTTERPSKD